MKNRMIYLHLFWVLAASLLFSASALGTEPQFFPAWTRLAGSESGVGRGQPMVGRHESGPRAAYRERSSPGGTTSIWEAIPLYGALKTLRIQARNSRGQSQQFIFREGNSIDAGQFYNYGRGPGGPGYPGNPVYPPNSGYPGGSNGNLQIIRAYYGLNQGFNDVHAIEWHGAERNPSVQVNNNNMGGDPAQGGDKVLTVVYRYQGREQTSTVKEGNTLRIP